MGPTGLRNLGVGEVQMGDTITHLHINITKYAVGNL